MVEKHQLLSKRRSSSLVMKRGDICWITWIRHRGGSRILGKGGLINIFTTGGSVREGACHLP